MNNRMSLTKKLEQRREESLILMKISPTLRIELTLEQLLENQLALMETLDFVLNETLSIAKEQENESRL